VERSISAIRNFLDELFHGTTVADIILNMAPEDIEDLQCVESQMAMISAVAKICHGKPIHEILLKYLKKHSRESLMNTVGTNAFVEVVKSTNYTRDEIMKFFEPRDFETVLVKKNIAAILNLTLQANSSQVEPKLRR
jgi:hypothetical protein